MRELGIAIMKSLRKVVIEIIKNLNSNIKIN